MAGRAPHWILADPHGGGDEAADLALLELLRHAARAGADLSILGDLFLAWLGRPRFWTAAQRRILEALAALRARGARVELVVGNRDYLVSEALFDAVHHEEVLLPLGGVPTLVAHGDLLNRADLFYLGWHAASRSLPARALLSALPGAVGRHLAASVAERFRGLNTGYKTGTLPMAALEALGRRAQARGAARALVGHFHHDRVVAVPGGAPVVIAPGWCEHRRILVVEPDGSLRSVGLGDLAEARPSSVDRTRARD